jgi:uncharacterized repeat protein (TIGR03843 family)
MAQQADVTRQPNGNWGPALPALEAVLARAAVREMKLLPSGSNYVFVLALEDDEAGTGVAIYKPRKGESPLWDYPNGTLYRRERAAYLLARALGWEIVPPTVIREGPHGVGAVQLYLDHDPRRHFFTERAARAEEFRRLALFDVIANNGDRKGGHCLVDRESRVWGIDHGLTFHHQGKLRTVIWDYVGEPLPEALLPAVAELEGQLAQGGEATAELTTLLNKQELRALHGRVERLLSERVYPEPSSHRPVPWPAI